MNTYIKERREEGFTLIELLIAIVVVGILTAVVIVGIGGLNDTGSKSACTVSLDAAKAAAVVHKANTGSYPTGFDVDLITAAELDTTDVTVDRRAPSSTAPTGRCAAPSAAATAPVMNCTAP